MNGTRVTCVDLETGASETVDLKDDFMVIANGSYYVSYVTRYANGTAVVTIKRKPTTEED